MKRAQWMRFQALVRELAANVGATSADAVYWPGAFPYDEHFGARLMFGELEVGYAVEGRPVPVRRAIDELARLVVERMAVVTRANLVRISARNQAPEDGRTKVQAL